MFRMLALLAWPSAARIRKAPWTATVIPPSRDHPPRVPATLLLLQLPPQPATAVVLSVSLRKQKLMSSTSAPLGYLRTSTAYPHLGVPLRTLPGHRRRPSTTVRPARCKQTPTPASSTGKIPPESPKHTVKNFRITPSNCLYLHYPANLRKQQVLFLEKVNQFNHHHSLR